MTEDNGSIVRRESIIRLRCDALAPLVVNGHSRYVGCDLDKRHEGPHSVTVKWARS